MARRANDKAFVDVMVWLFWGLEAYACLPFSSPRVPIGPERREAGGGWVMGVITKVSFI